MTPPKMGIYRHYKGCLCRVFGIAKHHDTGELFVMYESLHKDTDSQYWVRPIKEFTEELIIDGKKVQRFTFDSEEKNNRDCFGLKRPRKDGRRVASLTSCTLRPRH